MTGAPSIDEQYEAATNTSNLKVIGDRPGPGDIIIAAGWSKSRVGAALMRLHGEWDGAAKKRSMTDTDIMLLRMRLKSLSSVLRQVVIYLDQNRVENGIDKAGPIVGYWLYQVCGTCHGRQYELIVGTPIKGQIRCKSCGGSGVGTVPFGDEGRRVMSWLDECVFAARSRIKHWLRGDGER